MATLKLAHIDVGNVNYYKVSLDADSYMLNGDNSNIILEYNIFCYCRMGHLGVIKV